MEWVFSARITRIGGEAEVLARRGTRWTLGCGEVELRLCGVGLRERHALLEATPAGLVLHDLGGGVYVEHERVEGCRLLRVGEAVDLGELRLEILHVAPTGAGRTGRRGPARAMAAMAAMGAIGGSVALALWARVGDEEVAVAPEAAVAALDAAGEARGRAAGRSSASLVRVEHEVLPGETVGSIAARYGVSRRRLSEGNQLNPDRPLAVGQRLWVEAEAPPLPRQRLRVTVAEGETWAGLRARYGLLRAEIEAQNPGLGEHLDAGVTLELWVEPQVHRRRDVGRIPGLALDTAARSIGAPNHGRLERGVPLPPSPLYLRRIPPLMVGSGATITHLYAAIARFRQAYGYAGEVVVADLSRPEGGPLPPHRSHQSGRDVDVWLPTLGGAYQPDYLERDRRPHPDEVNWLAAWGLFESFLATGEVQEIFLNGALHERLFAAAEVMGAGPEALAEIQGRPARAGPRPAGSSPRIRTAEGHTGHFHVRFRCAPHEEECVARGEAP